MTRLRSGMLGMTVWRVLAFLVAWLVTAVAHAQERRLLVAFEDSARALPQQQIRQAIAVELAGAANVEPGGAEARAAGTPADRLVVALDAEGLWIKYQGPRGLIERHLPLPERAEQVPVVVSLAVGNLVREEAFELQRELERRPSDAELAERRAFAAERAPKPRRSSVPLVRSRPNALAYFVTGAAAEQSAVHDPCSSRGVSLGWKCYVGASPYAPPEGAGATVIGEQTRLAKLTWSVAYTRTLGPFGLSARAGLAVMGGGVVPWFAELRLRNGIFNVAWAHNAVRPFWYSGIGIGRTETRVAVEGADREGVEAVREHGPFFLVTGLGLTARLSDSWHAEAEWGFVAHLPKKGTMMQSGLALAYDF